MRQRNKYNYKKINYKKQIKSEDFERSADMPDGVEADLFAFFFLPLFHIEVRGKRYFSSDLISLCNFMLQFSHAHSPTVILHNHFCMAELL